MLHIRIEMLSVFIKASFSGGAWHIGDAKVLSLELSLVFGKKLNKRMALDRQGFLRIPCSLTFSMLTLKFVGKLSTPASCTACCTTGSVFLGIPCSLTFSMLTVKFVGKLSTPAMTIVCQLPRELEP